MTPPLPSWPAQAFPHEPVHGWFQRLADINGQISIRTLATYCGLNGRNLDLAQLLEFNELFPCIGRRHLVEATAAFIEGADLVAVSARNGKPIRLLGETLRFGFDYSIKAPRVCPACLRQERYYRAWFDIRAMVHCPFHGDRLTQGPRHDRLALWYPRIGVTPGGVDLAEVRNSDPPQDESLERYLLGRMGVAPAMVLPSLSAAPAHQIIEVAAKLGLVERCESGGRHHRESDLARVGFSALRHGEVGLTEHFASMAERPDGSRRLIQAARLLAGAQESDLRNLALKAVDEARRRHGWFSGRGAPPPGTLTLKEAAERLGLLPRKVRAIAVRLGLVSRLSAQGHSYAIPENRVPLIEQAIADSVVESEAAIRLGASTKAFRTLVDKGVITPLTRIGGASRLCDRFLPGDLDPAIKEQIAAIQRPQRRPRLKPGPRRIRGKPRRLRRWNGVSIAEAAGRLAIAPAKVCHLVRSGLLEQLPAEPGLMAGISEPSLDRFCRTYASTPSYADLLGISLSEVRNQLQSVGIAPVGETKADVLFFRKAEVVDRLGPDWDPDADGIDHRFWAAFRSALATAESKNRLVGGYGKKARLRASTPQIVAEINLSSERARVAFSFSATRGRSPVIYSRLLDRLGLIRSGWPEVHVASDLDDGVIELKEEFVLTPSPSDSDTSETARLVDERMTTLRLALLKAPKKSLQ